MKKLLLIFLFSFCLFAQDNTQALMDSIAQEAIVIGHGKDNMYVFVDPMCSKSKAFITLISEREDLQDKRTYHIFLYKLKKFDSFKLIQYIYQNPSRKTALLDIMVNEEEPSYQHFIAKKEGLETMKKIEKVAQQLPMKHRPYLILFEKGSSYCRVSEGSAPCLEGKDF